MSDYPRFLRLPEVCARTGLPRSTVYQRIKDGVFPKPYPLGASSAVGWLESEVSEWVHATVAARSATPVLHAA